MKHMLPWSAQKQKDGFFFVADAFGKKVVTVGDEPEDGLTAEMISACVNMSPVSSVMASEKTPVRAICFVSFGRMTTRRSCGRSMSAGTKKLTVVW